MQRLRYSRYLKTSIIILDILIIYVVYIFFFLHRNNFQLEKAQTEENILSLLLLSLFWILLSGRTKLYEIPRNIFYTLYLERIFTHFFFFLVGIALLAKVSNNDFLKYEKFWLIATFFTILVTVKSIIFFSIKYFRAQGKNHRNIMFLEENSSTEVLKNILTQKKDLGYKIHEFGNELDELEKIKEFWRKKGIHTMFIPTENNIEKTLEDKIFREAELGKVKICLVPNITQSNYFRFDFGYLETQPILSPAKFPLDNYANDFLKRIVDVIISLAFLAFIGIWLFPIIAIIIKLESKGNVFFKQERYGFHDEIFHCYKFRTMIENDECTSKTTTKNDIRITKIGKFLRRTSIDEMPQFINVLRGEMSIVGPRPHMILVDDYYKPRIGKYSMRSLVRPGITGLAQVNGLRGDNGNMDLEMKKRILADAYYVKNWSIMLDLVIIFRTIYILLKGDEKAF